MLILILSLTLLLLLNSLNTNDILLLLFMLTLILTLIPIPILVLSTDIYGNTKPSNPSSAAQANATSSPHPPSLCNVVDRNITVFIF